MRWTLAGWILVSLALAPRVQELSEKAEKFFAEYQGLLESQDLRGINRLVVRDAALAEEVIDQLCFRFALHGEKKALDDVRPLGSAVDDAQGAKRFAKRFGMLEAFTEPERVRWMQLKADWPKAHAAFNEAHSKKDATEFRRALSALDEIVQGASAIKDYDLAAVARYYTGVIHEDLEDHYEVVKAYDKGIDDWKAAERAKDNWFQHMVDTRRDLIEKGYDPAQKDRPAGVPGAPVKKNNTTSYKEGTDWEDWTTDYKEMKAPDQLTSTSPWCTDQVLLWREFGWSDKRAHEFGVLVQTKPFGTALKVVRDGAKGAFDINADGKGDQPLKVIDGKPTLNVVKSGSGKDAEPYAFFMLTGGQQNWFQTSVNYQTQGRYRVGCYREGRILGETVLLLDDNSSGSMGDPTETSDNILRGYPKWIDNDGVIVGKGRAIPWSDVLQVGGKWFHFKLVDPHGKKLRTRELDIDSGQVALDWSGPVPPKYLVVAEVRDFKGAYFDVSGGKPVTVPVGRYEIAYGRIESGKAGQSKQAWLFKGESPAFEVKAGETVTLKMGAPYTFEFSREDQGKALVVQGKSIYVKEKTGAIVGRIYDEICYPDVAARRAGGGAFGKPGTMKKIDPKTFNEDNVAAWFPANFVIEKPEKEKLEVQLTMKKHALLGEGFSSAWK